MQSFPELGRNRGNVVVLLNFPSEFIVLFPSHNFTIHETMNVALANEAMFVVALLSQNEWQVASK
jgi:hypothetical protein